MIRNATSSEREAASEVKKQLLLKPNKPICLGPISARALSICTAASKSFASSGNELEFTWPVDSPPPRAENQRANALTGEVVRPHAHR